MKVKVEVGRQTQRKTAFLSPVMPLLYVVNRHCVWHYTWYYCNEKETFSGVLHLWRTPLMIRLRIFFKWCFFCLCFSRRSVFANFSVAVQVIFVKICHFYVKKSVYSVKFFLNVIRENAIFTFTTQASTKRSTTECFWLIIFLRFNKRFQVI